MTWIDCKYKQNFFNLTAGRHLKTEFVRGYGSENTDQQLVYFHLVAGTCPGQVVTGRRGVKFVVIERLNSPAQTNFITRFNRRVIRSHDALLDHVLVFKSTNSRSFTTNLSPLRPVVPATKFFDEMGRTWSAHTKGQVPNLSIPSQDLLARVDSWEDLAARWRKV